MVRRLFIVFAFLVCFGAVIAAGAMLPGDLHWHVARKATIAWSQDYKLEDGRSLPSGTIKWLVYLRDAAGNERQVTSKPITMPRYTLTLPGEGSYLVGVQSVRTATADKSDTAVVAAAPIVWSSDPAVVAGRRPFGLRFFSPPASPTGLRVR